MWFFLSDSFVKQFKSRVNVDVFARRKCSLSIRDRSAERERADVVCYFMYVFGR